MRIQCIQYTILYIIQTILNKQYNICIVYHHLLFIRVCTYTLSINVNCELNTGVSLNKIADFDPLMG